MWGRNQNKKRPCLVSSWTIWAHSRQLWHKRISTRTKLPIKLAAYSQKQSAKTGFGLNPQQTLTYRQLMKPQFKGENQLRSLNKRVNIIKRNLTSFSTQIKRMISSQRHNRSICSSITNSRRRRNHTQKGALGTVSWARQTDLQESTPWNMSISQRNQPIRNSSENFKALVNRWKNLGKSLVQYFSHHRSSW
jgi:hypothetical protein